MAMTAARRERVRTVVYSLVLLVVCLGAWQALAGAGGKGSKGSGIPGPVAVAQTSWHMLADPFYDRGPNDKGFGLQLAYSLGRLVMGYLAASVVAIMLGVALGSSPALFKAANPFIQILKPVSPLAWMPLFLYTIKNAGQAAVLVIFMSSLMMGRICVEMLPRITTRWCYDQSPHPCAKSAKRVGQPPL